MDRRSTPAFSLNDLRETPGANINIHGGSFVHAEGDSIQNQYYHVTPPVLDERGLQTLLQGIARDAMYDSAERYPPPKCHPDTRVEILKEIQDWINDPSTPYPVFWLHAPVGEGKSAIMQGIAQLLSSPDGNVVATFFFGRGKGKREQAQYLFSTLAHQLALNVPGLRAHIDQIMRLKPTIASSSMDFQVRFLFIDAFAMLEHPPPIPLTILIDGLDECNDQDDQQSILNLIGKIIAVHGLSLRFLIASRPEPQLLEAFDAPILRGMTIRATIANYFSSHTDIERFLRDRFADIYRRKSRSIGAIQGPTWPSDEIIKFLVSKSSGQFIYAAIVIKFVDDKFSLPGRQLNIILSRNTLHKNAFSDLDSLYLNILSTYPDCEILTRVLGFIAMISGPVGIVLEDLLRLERGEVELILQGLHSVLYGTSSTTVKEPGPTWKDSDSDSDDSTELTMDSFDWEVPLDTEGAEISSIHASFEDFLFDRHRAGRYYIDKAEYNVRIVTSAFSVMSNFILDCLRGAPQRQFSGRTVTAMGDTLFLNLADLTSVPQSSLDDIAEIEEEFRNQGLPKDLPAGFMAPIEAFLAIDLFITAAMQKMQDDAMFSRDQPGVRQEYCLQLSHLNHRYLRSRYLFYDEILSREDHPLSAIPGILVMREDLSSQALANLFMVDPEIIVKFWKGPRDIIKGYKQYWLPEKSLDFLTTMDLTLEENGRLCRKVAGHHLNLCRQFLLRFFSRNWADTPEPHKGIRNYIEQYFAYHLQGLSLAPSEDDFLFDFLDILDGFEIRYSDIGQSSANKLGCIWILLKRIVTWLAQIDTSTRLQSSSFGKRVQSTFDRICGQIFCVTPNARLLGQNVITIREPFLGVEKILISIESPDDEFAFRTALYEPIILLKFNHPHLTWISDMDSQAISNGRPTGLSEDIFLLDFSEMNLDTYFTDECRACSMYLHPQFFYPCALECLQNAMRQRQALEDEETAMFQEAKLGELMEACIFYLRNAPYCNSWMNKPGRERVRLREHGKFKCRILDWCQRILDTSPESPRFHGIRRAIEEVKRDHHGLYLL